MDNRQEMILSEDLSTDNCFLDNYILRMTSL